MVEGICTRLVQCFWPLKEVVNVRTMEMKDFARPIDLLTRDNDSLREKKSLRPEAKDRGLPGKHLRSSHLCRGRIRL